MIRYPIKFSSRGFSEQVIKFHFCHNHLLFCFIWFDSFFEMLHVKLSSGCVMQVLGGNIKFGSRVVALSNTLSNTYIFYDRFCQTVISIAVILAW